MRKLWLDVETTGLDTEKHGIIQLACLMENSKGKIIDKFELTMKPFKDCIYDKKAEEIHGKSKKVIKKYMPEKQALTNFILWLQQHQNGRQQYSIAGYNSRFDQDFISALFDRNEVNFWTYFNYYDVDVYAMVKVLDLDGEDKKGTGKRLTCLCDTFNIEINAHDAMSDIKATRKLYAKLMKKYIK